MIWGPALEQGTSRRGGGGSKVLSLFLRERNIKEPAASKYRREFLTWIDKPLLFQAAWALQSLVPPCCVRADPGNGGAPFPSCYCCLGAVKSHAVSWAHFHMALMSRVKPMSLGFSRPRIRRCFMMATNSLLLSSPFPATRRKNNQRPTTNLLEIIILKGSSLECPLLQKLRPHLLPPPKISC